MTLAGARGLSAVSRVLGLLLDELGKRVRLNIGTQGLGDLWGSDGCMGYVSAR